MDNISNQQQPLSSLSLFMRARVFLTCFDAIVIEMSMQCRMEW